MSKKYKRYAAAMLLAVMMVLAAELVGNHEVIFPEIIALLVGAVILPRQPWRCSKPMLVILMTVASIAGVCIVRFLPLPLLAQVGIAFTLIALSLTFTRTTLVPMVSACILPILLHTTTWVYPVSVLAATLAIVLVKLALERFGLVEKPEGATTDIPIYEALVKWGKLLLLFLLLAALPTSFHTLYFIAPPLIVTFVEFSIPGAKLRDSKCRILLLTGAAALIGTCSKLLLCNAAGLPLTLSALVTILCVFTLMERTQILFPPAGAIAFLPLILPSQGLWLYPVEVIIGAAVMILAAIAAFPDARPAGQKAEDAEFPPFSTGEVLPEGD